MAKVPIEPETFPFFDYRRYAFSLGLETPDCVVLSGHSGFRYDAAGNQPVVEGDIVQQARTSYEKIRITLEAAGLGLSEVVRTVDYVPSQGIGDYQEAAKLRREIFGETQPATTTVVVNRLLRPEALIEIEAVASRNEHRPVDPGWPKIDLPSSVARRAANILYISAQLPVRPGTEEIVGEGDVVAQAHRIYENAGAILSAAGLGWDNVVKTVDFLTPDALANYRETAHVRREYLSGAYPVATGIIMPRVSHPGALLQVDFTAIDAERQIINPGWSRYDRLTYVPAVRAGNLLFLSGQGSRSEDTGVFQHAGDIVGQTRYVYSKIGKVLEAAGTDLDAIIKTVEFVTPAGLENYRATAAVRRELFKSPYPVATGVVCEQLLGPEMLIEVDVLAVLT